MPKGDPRKVKLAWTLRQNTPMTLQWIADKLEMGSSSYVHNLLASRRKKEQNASKLKATEPKYKK